MLCEYGFPLPSWERDRVRERKAELKPGEKKESAFSTGAYGRSFHFRPLSVRTSTMPIKPISANSPKIINKAVFGFMT